jgi:hypothetical protein
MSTKLTVPTLLAAILAAGCASPDLSRHSNPKLLGDPMQPSADTLTAVITAERKSVNVMAGQTVRFVVGDKSFTWNFSGTRYTAPIDLRTIAPPGLIDRPVTIYIWNNPAYLGGG